MTQLKLAKTPEEMKYPLLDWDKFPNFGEIKSSPVVPAFDLLVKRVEAEFKKREDEFTPSWEGTMGLIEDLEDDVFRAYNIVSHLNGVCNSEELRKAIEVIEAKNTKLVLLMNQSPKKYNALTALVSSPSFSNLNQTQQRIINKTIQEMQLAGVGLPEGSPEKNRFNEIKERLSLLNLKFQNNVLDSTKAFKEIVNDRKELEGCSERLLKLMAGTAKKEGIGDGDFVKGPWVVTLDQPVYVPFMMLCSNRPLREKVYRAYVTRASSGETNNEPVINEILKLRKEEAKLLGYDNYASVSLAQKMAAKPSTANALIRDLIEASSPAGKREIEELTVFARDTLGHPIPLAPWDISYISEQYRKHVLRFSEDDIAQYFSFDKVIGGLFSFVEEVLNVKVDEINQKEEGISTWNEDVKVFRLADKNSGETLAYFYGDFYCRIEEKRSGAWMDMLCTRYKNPKTGEVRLPVAYLVCNQPPPSKSGPPSTMTFSDVKTVFHEFGHCLQHLCTTVDYFQASGIKGIEWDFVEVASQFMENFCYEQEWVARLSAHHVSGDPMPQDMVDSLAKRRTFLAATAMLRQLRFASSDLALYSTFPLSDSDAKQKTVFDLDREISERILVVPLIPEDRFLCGFLHIFGGSYAAGYYSYKWSEVYSADAYAAFEEAAEGLTGKERIDAIVRTGKLYRETVLSLGGGTHPAEVWKLFRGRESADIKPLLRHAGLIA
ncbi:1990_t:CDS:10 [Paraglomus occultum]|uniref:oligopeptidase A n=1 Tax=Paraglomus occultum TaxID=144539 RepID=A0A9N9GNM2_9GLOM|nr:1990_t:CDS:10 [Paraglomus occultum]